MTDTISILMLTYNRLEAVKACVESLQRVESAFDEWYILDNCSTDGARRYLIELCGSIQGRYIILKCSAKNLGVADGRQKLTETAGRSSDILLFLDSDVIVHSAALFDTIRAAFADEAVGVVGCGGSYIDWSHEHPFFPAPIGKVDVVQGWCMAVRRELFSAIAFDTGYGLFGEEDSDICLQVREQGFDVVSINPTGLIEHKADQSSNTDRPITLKRFHDKWAGKGWTKGEGGYA